VPVSRRAPTIADGFQFFTTLYPVNYSAQEISPARSEYITRPHDDRPCTLDLRPSLAFEFETSIYAQRTRLITLCIKTVFQTIENVIRRYGQERSANFAARTREVLRSGRVRKFCLRRITFTTINICPRGAINHGVRPLSVGHTLHLRGIANIQRLTAVNRLASARNNFVSIRETVRNTRPANQTTRACNQDFFQSPLTSVPY
jgi:hypothetical protein